MIRGDALWKQRRAYLLPVALRINGISVHKASHMSKVTNTIHSESHHC